MVFSEKGNLVVLNLVKLSMFRRKPSTFQIICKWRKGILYWLILFFKLEANPSLVSVINDDLADSRILF